MRTLRIPAELRRLFAAAEDLYDPAMREGHADVDVITEWGVFEYDGAGTYELRYYPAGGREVWCRTIAAVEIPAWRDARTIQVDVMPLGDLRPTGPVRPLLPNEVERPVDDALRSALERALTAGEEHSYALLRPEILTPRARIRPQRDCSTVVEFPADGDTIWIVKLHATELRAAALGTRTVPVVVRRTGGRLLRTELAEATRESEVDRPEPVPTGRFLELVFAQGWLELTGDALGSLDDDTQRLANEGRANASALIELWLTHRAVDDVYVSDEELAELLGRWA